MKSTQTGAALAIGLILLSILTLLAVSTMNTAATELMMSGNDQYRLRAAQAAEIGIEQTIAAALFRPTAVQTHPTSPLPGGDSYSATIRPRGSTPAPAGYNNTFTAEHYEIESTGHSHRGVQVTYIQGLFVVRDVTSPTTAANPALPPLCLVGIEIRPQLCRNIGTPIRTYWRPAT
jgi:hypothetical protein